MPQGYALTFLADFIYGAILLSTGVAFALSAGSASGRTRLFWILQASSWGLLLVNHSIWMYFDLVLRKGENFVIVDHKTGRDFSPQDELQMAIYVEYIRREYGGKECPFYYDHYRWVNNLQRIRKPAFQRTRVVLPKRYWEAAEARIHAAQRTIERIRRQGWGVRNGQCFRCPYRGVC
jgi:hypothetical protein